MLWRCSVLCGRSMHCVVGLFAVCYGGVLCATVVYCMLWWCTACYGYLLGQCNVW